MAVDDDQIVAACTTPAIEGMVVRTDHPIATAAVHGTLELLVSSLPARALDLPAERSELVRACVASGIGVSRLTAGPPKGSTPPTRTCASIPIYASPAAAAYGCATRFRGRTR